MVTSVHMASMPKVLSSWPVTQKILQILDIKLIVTMDVP